MGLVFIQLSDMHFSVDRAAKNSLLDRMGALCGAVRSVVEPGENCVLVFSGDIANWGLEKEYDIAESFMKAIHSEISKHTGVAPLILIIPGNHDMNFVEPDFDEKIRDIIIKNSDPKEPPNDAMSNYCFKPQRPYREFIQKISASLPVLACSDLAASEVHDFDTFKVRFHLLNTTRFSHAKEVAGVSWFPIHTLEEKMNLDRDTDFMTIAVLHHPYNWHRPENASEMRRLLESHCDVILTGHEHDSDIYIKSRRATQQNFYVEGGILQDPYNAENSSFNVVRVVTERKVFLCTTFEWNGTAYEERADTYEHRYLRLRQPLMNQFELGEDWSVWLEQIGTDFRHPRCRELKLDDIFIYPDLQRLDVRKACTRSGFVRDRDVLGYVQEKRRVLIAGAEKTGKTSLSKRLFSDLREAGYVPVLIRSDFAIDQRAKTTKIEQFKQAIDKVIQKTYSPSSAKRFWQTKVEERAIIIDDYHRLRVSIGGRDELLQWIDDNFRIIVIFSSPGIRMTDILNRNEADTLLWTFEHVDILEADAESRHELIQKWLVAGVDRYQPAIDTLYERTVRYEQVIDSVVGQGAVPSLPLFIHMMMQQLETRGPIDSSTGLYGSLYELIIRDVVRAASYNPADLEVKLNYLSEFAGALYAKDKRFLDDKTFQEWHHWYCDEFNVELKAEEMILQLESIGVFRKDEEMVGFKYRYYYCFFLARHISRIMHHDTAIEIMKKLCSVLHTEDAANTMLFLCHLSKDPRILSLILERVRGHFVGAPEYLLSESPSVIPAGTIRPNRLVLTSESPHEERLRTLRERDEIERPHGLDEIKEHEEKQRQHKMIALINEANSTLHSIRICGQVIRNFYGEMRGNLQIEVIRECFGLCLRMMSVLFECLENEKEELASVVGEILKHRDRKITDDELDKQVKRSLYSMAFGICYGLLKHTSNSLGLADLKLSFDKLIAERDVSISHRMLDLSTRLDFFDVFPESLVSSLAAELGEGTIGREVLRYLVWEHFKLFTRDFKVRQRVCQLLEIEANQPVLISMDEKKIKGG